MLSLFALLLVLVVANVAESAPASFDGQFEHVWDTCVRIIAFYVLACFFFLQIPGIAASLGGGAAAMVSQFGNAVMSGGGAVATGAGHAASDARAMGASMGRGFRSEEHTSELQSLMRNSYAVFCLKKKKNSKELET